MSILMEPLRSYQFQNAFIFAIIFKFAQIINLRFHQEFPYIQFVMDEPIPSPNSTNDPYLYDVAAINMHNHKERKEILLQQLKETVLAFYQYKRPKREVLQELDARYAALRALMETQPQVRDATNLINPLEFSPVLPATHSESQQSPIFGNLTEEISIMMQVASSPPLPLPQSQRKQQSPKQSALNRPKIRRVKMIFDAKTSKKSKQDQSQGSFIIDPLTKANLMKSNIKQFKEKYEVTNNLSMPTSRKNIENEGSSVGPNFFHPEKRSMLRTRKIEAEKQLRQEIVRQRKIGMSVDEKIQHKTS